MNPPDLPLEIDPPELQPLLEGEGPLLLLDCREQEEFDIVKLEAATLLPMSTLQQRVEEIRRHSGDRVVVYCHHGGRSLQVAQWLRGQGFAQAQSLRGGIDRWAQEVDASLPRY